MKSDTVIHKRDTISSVYCLYIGRKDVLSIFVAEIVLCAMLRTNTVQLDQLTCLYWPYR